MFWCFRSDTVLQLKTFLDLITSSRILLWHFLCYALIRPSFCASHSCFGIMITSVNFKTFQIAVLESFRELRATESESNESREQTWKAEKVRLIENTSARLIIVYQWASFNLLCLPTSTSLHHPNNLQISVLPSEKLMSPRRCRSLMEANTNTTMPTVCSPSVSQIAFSITPPSAHSPPPYPDPNPEPEPASSTSGPPPGPGPPFSPGPALQFPCTNSSATPAQAHGPGAPWHPPSARLFSKSTLGKVKIGD